MSLIVLHDLSSKNVTLSYLLHVIVEAKSETPESCASVCVEDSIVLVPLSFPLLLRS
jgi:hypothetical protein